MTQSMTVPTSPEVRAFWYDVVTRGGATVLPRWSRDPSAGIAEHGLPVPDGLAVQLRDVAGRLHCRPATLMLAAHAAVLTTLTGEHEVLSEYLVDDEEAALPCLMGTASATWRGLVAAASAAEAQLFAHSGVPVAALIVDLAGEAGMPPPRSEAVFGLPPEGLPSHAVIAVALVVEGDGLTVRVRHRTECLDADAAARIAGYHLAALRAMVADPDAEHDASLLLSRSEVIHQLHGLSGPRVDLPDRRVHEIFEARVRDHPDAVAVTCGQQELTYAELNSRANRLARALLAHGLCPEDVVAVVTERTLGWMVAVLAIFKAGGAYLPIDPHFPSERIAATMKRAHCRLALSEGDTREALEAPATWSGVEVVEIETADGAGHDVEDLHVPVTADQLAYLYFTSGSTGEPKGAMCEHAGMLNHLHAKIADLGITAGQTVAQTAPQCFDISLWQLLAAVLVGGRTAIVEQDTIMDAERFLDRVAGEGVNVVQVVPSYLEVLLSSLERRPRHLPDLRCVSVTGEALKPELVRRWFAARPGSTLVNAYGLTETSDDTNHEVMTGPPGDGRIALGAPVQNVHVTVVDERLRPVPLGAPGEIVFSGVCVGRGYVNDPERTAQAFGSDPHRKGLRLYRSGDFGRWRPDGKLEFLGRRDNQVKVNGFRIEIGEVESALLRAPGVRDGAVVVAERNGGGKQLVAFYAADTALDADELRTLLGAALPTYMVPAVFTFQDRLPLTANGKIDGKRLTALAASAQAAPVVARAPRTATERRLAAAFARVLGIDERDIGRDDHFFDRGGTSLSAVKLAIALDRAVSFRDLTGHPVLSDLAALMDGRAVRSAGLLQVLASPGDSARGTLVCFPYAGGNAVNFQAMASRLRDSGIAVHAIELPGHDLTREREPFATLAEVADRAAAEIAALADRPILLWGHSSGAVIALETARMMEARGLVSQGVVVAAQVIGGSARLLASIAALEESTDTELAQHLLAEGSLGAAGELDARRSAHAAAAYRHDALAACRHLLATLRNPPADRLTAPVSVVLAADDPSTAEPNVTYRDWELVAASVTLHDLPEGGHHFLRTRPDAAALAALAAFDASPTT